MTIKGMGRMGPEVGVGTTESGPEKTRLKPTWLLTVGKRGHLAVS